MLHPVGPLPARVYWRRRVLLLALLVSVLGGGGWTGWAAWTGHLPVHLSTASALAPAPQTGPQPATPAEPALASVLPSLAGVRVPVVPPAPAGGTGPSGGVLVAAVPVPVPAAPATPALLAPAAATVSGPACGDDSIGLTLSAPRSATVGGSAVVTLTVIDASVLPCTRDVGTAAREVVLLDVAGDRLWSSADCTAPASAPERFTPGDRVDLDVPWDGRTSAAGCAGPRTVVPAGSYVLRARLGTRTAADVPLTLG